MADQVLRGGVETRIFSSNLLLHAAAAAEAADHFSGKFETQLLTVGLSSIAQYIVCACACCTHACVCHVRVCMCVYAPQLQCGPSSLLPPHGATNQTQEV